MVKPKFTQYPALLALLPLLTLAVTQAAERVPAAEALTGTRALAPESQDPAVETAPGTDPEERAARLLSQPDNISGRVSALWQGERGELFRALLCAGRPYVERDGEHTLVEIAASGEESSEVEVRGLAPSSLHLKLKYALLDGEEQLFVTDVGTGEERGYVYLEALTLEDVLP